MSTLLCFGLGYSAQHYVAEYGARFKRIVGTVRTAAKAERIDPDGGVEPIVFDKEVDPRLETAIAASRAMLVSIPPTEAGDPILAVLSDRLAEASHLTSIVYLSSVGVYGDHGGGWVDETAAPDPSSPRSRARLMAEKAWQDLGVRYAKSVAVLRLAGIYGPGRNALSQLANGSAKRIVKPGQVFSRIHVADIAQVIDHAFARSASGIFNVCDDEPTAPQDAVSFAAELLGVEAPPELPFAEASKDMSPMALSFYAGCRRVRNERIKRELGVSLRFPGYREGLRALHAAGAY
jgi:nucleoside-diphosphate-sugar epimerase